jgi:hypothetical protein
MLLIGIILIIAAVGLAIYFKTSNVERPKFLTGKRLALIGVIGFILTAVNGLFFYAEAGHSYLVQYPTGTQVAVLDPGIKIKAWGQVYEWKKVITVKFDSDPENNEKYTGSGQEIDVRFNDAVNAKISLSARFSLPTDEETFKKMAVEFRSQQNLVNSSLLPSCNEVTKNSARLIAAQEYIAGRGGEFEYAVFDQLENGVYILDAQPLKQGVDSISADSANRTIDNNIIKRFTVKKRLNKDGSIKRKTNPINQYRIKVSQAVVENVDPEERFKVMLGKQRDVAAQTSISKESAKKAEFEKQKILAEGESEKAKKLVELETKQVEIITAAETEMKKAKIKKQTEQAELEAARLKAQSIKVLADAESYKKRQIMVADGALEKKLATYEKVMSTWAEAYAKRSVPTYWLGGGADGGPNGMFNQFMTLQNMSALKDLNLSMQSK